MTRFLVVPQWQGSPSSRAMSLIDGAEAVSGDLPRASTTRIEIPLGAGEALDTGVRRYSTLHRVQEALRAELAGSDERTLVIGGDCGVAVAAVEHSARAGRIALVWADAHPDLHTPATSPSGAFSGMALRAVLGEGAAGLTLPAGTVDPGDVVLLGAREPDAAEDVVAAERGMRVVECDALADPELLADIVGGLGVDGVHVHVDVDVLDPAQMPGVKDSAPFGADLGHLTAAIRALRERVPLVGASLCEFTPASADSAQEDMGTMLRLVGALA